MSNKPRLVEINTFFDEMPESNIEHETKGGRLATLLVGAVAFLAIVLIVPTIIVLPMAFAIDAVMQEARGAWHAVPATVPEVPSTLPGFTYVYDSAGNVVAQFYAENRQPVTFDEVSPLLVDAIVSVEDRRFWDHNGVDGNSVVRAAYANYIAGGAVQGASTLTQQLVENLKLLSAGSAEERDLARAQTLGGKVVEAKTALAMEAQMSKNEILEAYMNVVYFGAGSYGVAAAADRFFGVDVADLSVAQAATIAGMVREPSGLDPFRFPERAQSRRDTVLLAMRETGAITLWEYVTATNSPLDTSGGNQQPNGCTTSAYPFYCSIVREQLLADGRLGRTQPQRDNAIAQGHLAVYTALDPAVMASIDASIAAAFDDSNRVATAVAVDGPGTGLVKGFGQNRQWGDGEGETEIPYVLSGFQPGSAFKAVIMAAALENGFNAHTAMSTRSGFRPSGFDYPDGGFDNYGGANYGTIDAYRAARLSSNVWFTKLITINGVDGAVEMAKKMGVRTSLNGLSVSPRSAAFALGAWEVQPLEMASVYATVASAGSSCEPVFITDIVDTTTGDSLGASQAVCTNAYGATTASTLTDILQEPFKTGGTAAAFPLGDREAVGKTGTTNDYGAAWFAGATPQYATAVWVGDPRGGQAHPLTSVYAYGGYFDHVFGADISGPLWNDVMTRLHSGLPAIAFSDVAQRPVSPVLLAGMEYAPNVEGMALAQAVALLNSRGYSTTVDPLSSEESDPGVVQSIALNYRYAVLTVGTGSAPKWLGQDVATEAGVLVLADGQ